MRQIFYLTIFITLLTSCNSSKNLTEHVEADRPLFAAIEKLNKKPDDAKAAKALPALYADAQKRYLDKINEYSKQKDINKWQDILNTYDVLQRMYIAINESFAGGRSVRPVNYQPNIMQAKEQAAAEYYQIGLASLQENNREAARKSWQAFIKANELVPGYKDTEQKIELAYNKTALNVVIMPLNDKAAYGNGISREENAKIYKKYTNALAEVLSNNIDDSYPARFYTAAQAESKHISPDWVVNLTLDHLVIRGPEVEQRTTLERDHIQGVDTAGRPAINVIERNVTRSKLVIKADIIIKLDVVESATNKTVVGGKFPHQYLWEYGSTIPGDDYARRIDYTVGPNTIMAPGRSEICNTLYYNTYQKIKDKIIVAVKEHEENASN